MTREGTLPLDSYRLARYAVPVPCYICGEGNPFDNEMCHLCNAPMGLAHQAESQKCPPRLMGVIGSSGVGKTVYLGMLLDMLARQPSRLQMLARGAFSLTLPQTTAAALSQGEFPAKTPSEPDRWNWVHCQVRSPQQRQPLELIMPDMAGESLFEEVDHPHSYKVIRMLLSKCSGVILLIDSLRLHTGTLNQDYFCMKLLTYVTELEHHDVKRSCAQLPLGIVFSKADECEECFHDPSGYAKAHAPGLWQQCQDRFKTHRFFAAGVAGSCASRVDRHQRIRVPLRVEPRGIIEPFEWLIGHMKG